MKTWSIERAWAVVSLIGAVALVGCKGDEPNQEGDGATEGESEAGEQQFTYTYWRDAKAVIDKRCVGCHQDGEIAPFPLTSHAEVDAVAAILPGAIESGAMPPWPPSNTCNSYQHERSLSPDEQELLLTWLAEGAPEGDPSDAPEPETPDVPDFQADTTVAMPEAYTPTQEPDDYRCFVIPWEAAQGYVTATEVLPDQRSIVHHVIAYVVEPDQVASVTALDEQDAGPGYTCFGGPGIDARWLASWVPGAMPMIFPEGMGVRVDAGSALVVQMHYNTSSSDPVADQTALAFELAESVDRPMLYQPFTNLQWVLGAQPMTIPAGDPEVTHSFEMSADAPVWASLISETGVQAGEPVLVHAGGLHMHTLGVSARLSILRADASEDCVVEIPDWDFHWQGGYDLQEPLMLGPGDKLRIECTWDNSAENQPIIDGELAEPIDVAWGEGTRDEMCLAVLGLSRP